MQNIVVTYCQLTSNEHLSQHMSRILEKMENKRLEFSVIIDDSSVHWNMHLSPTGLALGPRWGYFLSMPNEPETKRTIAFFDGQNLFHQAAEAFQYDYPNYSPTALADAICESEGLTLLETRFYTGIPERSYDPFWNHFWSAKLLAMSRQGVITFSRPLRRRRKEIPLKGGCSFTAEVSEEKGVDIRIALDIMRLTRRNALDVVLLFSQDQDFSEVADEVRDVAKEHDRWIRIISAFPLSPRATNKRGVNKTQWIEIDRLTYDSCIDPRDYRPKRKH